MNRKQWIVVIAAASLSAAGLGVHRLAQAQQEPPAGGGQQFPNGVGTFGNGRARFGGGGGPTQMAVSGNSLFILRGNTLYRVNTTSLAVEAKADLPADTSQANAFRGGGRFRSGNPGPNAVNPTAPGDNGAPGGP